MKNHHVLIFLLLPCLLAAQTIFAMQQNKQRRIIPAEAPAGAALVGAYQLSNIDSYDKETFQRALQIACRNSDVRAVEVALTLGALEEERFARKINFADIVNRTHARMNGANMNRRIQVTLTRENALWFTSNPEITERLIKAGAHVNTLNRQNLTPLMRAVNQNPSVVPILIQNGANLDIKGSNGETALIMAAKNGRLEAVQELLSAGADASTADNNGLRAVNHATQKFNAAPVRDEFEIRQALKFRDIVRLLSKAKIA